jgi:hypothetical protein
MTGAMTNGSTNSYMLTVDSANSRIDRATGFPPQVWRGPFPIVIILLPQQPFTSDSRFVAR